MVSKKSANAPREASAAVGSLAELGRSMDAFVASRGWYGPRSSRPQSPRNLAISLSIEASELLECFQWSDAAEGTRVADELADVMLYALQLANVMEIDLAAAAMRKLRQNMGRSCPDSEPQRR